MSYKPGDFFLGVVEFFGIMLPGAILAFLLLGPASGIFDDKVLPRLSGGVQVAIAFLVAAYVLGQGLDAFGSLVVDQITNRLYRDRKARGSKKLLDRAKAIRERTLGSDHDMVTAFRWARTVVELRSKEGARAIERLEADAKFFRSLTVVLVIATIRFALTGPVLLSFASALFALLAGTRTAVERWQRNKTAYEFYIAEGLLGESPPSDPPAPGGFWRRLWR